MAKKRIEKNITPIRRNCVNIDDPEFSRKPKEGHGFIYRYHFIKNGKDYIGQTKHTVRKRLIWHTSKNIVVDKIIRSGAKFTVEILSEPKLEYLNDAEDYCITYFNTLIPNGYNQLIGCQNNPMSDPKIVKIVTEKMKRYIDTHPEEKRRRSELKKRYWKKNRDKLPERFRPQKLMCLETGKIYSSSIEASKDTGACDIQIRKASRLDRIYTTPGGMHWILYQDGYEDIRKEILEIYMEFIKDKTKVRTYKTKVALCKTPVFCKENGKRYMSINDASKDLGIAFSHLRRCVYEGKPAKGFHVSYITSDGHESGIA